MRAPTPEIFSNCRKKGYNTRIVDIGGGFPVPYDSQSPRFVQLAKVIRSECTRLFPKDTELIAEPGRFMVATAASLVSEIIGKARRDGKIVVVPALGHLYTVAVAKGARGQFPVFSFEWVPRWKAERGAARIRTWLQAISQLAEKADQRGNS